MVSQRLAIFAIQAGGTDPSVRGGHCGLPGIRRGSPARRRGPCMVSGAGITHGVSLACGLPVAGLLSVANRYYVSDIA